MRIALIGRRFDAAGGGTERDLIVTARILAAAGHQVSVYADEVRTRSDEFEVRRIPALRLGRALRLIWFAARAGKVARREGADLLLSFARIVDSDIIRSGGGAHSSYVKAARRWQSTMASTAMRLSPYHRAQIAIEQAGFNEPALRSAIAVSNFVRRDLLETFHLSTGKVVTLYNGVDLHRFHPNHNKSLSAKIRCEFKIPDDRSAIAFVGNGFARKGLKFLIDAWPLVNPPASLVVAGADRAVDAYRRRAIQRGVGGRVIFLGAAVPVERLFAAVDGLALPSLFEPFGNVVLEAMAAGLPVLCTSATGAAELMPEELSRLVVDDPTNISELARRLNLLLKIDRDAADAARATAEQYTWDRYGAELLRII